MPMLNNPQKAFHKGFENFTVAFLLESGYNTSEYTSREEYLDALTEEDDSWEEEYAQWRDEHYGDASHYHDYLNHYA